MPEPRSPEAAPPPSGHSTALESLLDDQFREAEPTQGVTAFDAVESGPEGESSKKRLGFAAWLAVAWIVFVVGSALLAPLLPLKHPQAVQGVEFKLLEPGSSDAILGTDGTSRDVLSRTIWGSRASLTIGVGAIMLGFAVGGTLGVIGAYYRGWLGTGITYTLDIFLAWPALILALFIVTIFGRSVWWIAFALGVVAIPILARIARASTLVWSEREFVLAARAQGAKNKRIIIREILPNVLPSMYSIALLSIAVAIIAEAGLAQLGVGITLPNPSWGNIILEGRAEIKDAPWLITVPSTFIFLTVLSLNYLGDVIRARFDVRESTL